MPGKLWTDEEVASLLAQIRDRPTWKAKVPGRTPGAIRDRVKRMRRNGEIPERCRRGLRWTEAEDAYLRAAAGLDPVGVIAERVGRSEDAVRKQCLRLGLKVPCDPSTPNPNPERWYTSREVEAVLGRAPRSLRAHWRRLGLTKRRETARRGAYLYRREDVDRLAAQAERDQSLWTAKRAAREFGVEVGRLRDWAQRGWVPLERRGRWLYFDPDEIRPLAKAWRARR